MIGCDLSRQCEGSKKQIEDPNHVAGHFRCDPDLLHNGNAEPMLGVEVVCL
jgi:hypothetical protein